MKHRRKSTRARPKPSSAEDPDEWKDFNLDALKRRDELALESLRAGFVFAALASAPAASPKDFTALLPHLDDLSNLVVCAPALKPDETESFIQGLDSRPLDGGTRMTTRELFFVAWCNWLKPPLVIVPVFVVAGNPPFEPEEFHYEPPWILVADLTVFRRRNESLLRVVHLGRLTRERAIWRFLVPNALVPSRVIL